MKALLVIDMQKGSFKPYPYRHDTLGTVERINKLTSAFRENNFPVIFIQHDGTIENWLLPGTEDWELLPELIRLPSDICVSKTANDSFIIPPSRMFYQALTFQNYILQVVPRIFVWTAR